MTTHSHARPAPAPSPLQQMTTAGPTCLWNDSAARAELEYSLSHGAVGATCNPVIVLDVLKKEMPEWRPHIETLARERPAATEGEIAWRLVEDISAARAAMLREVFDAHRGRNGRLSIQTDPRYYRDAAALVDQAMRFHQLAPNMIVKLPATRAGIEAIEEVTARGVSINATVSFTLPQALAVADAVERGLARRERDGHDIGSMGPVCTIMVGRLDDWLKVGLARAAIAIDPPHLEWAGIAVFKKTYRLFQERGYRARLLCAAFRNQLQWSELIGGDIVISPPAEWQKRFAASGIEVRRRIDTPVDPAIVDSLSRHFADFRRAYDAEGLRVEQFDDYPPTRRTLRQFLTAGDDLRRLVRDVMIPNPDAP